MNFIWCRQGRFQQIKVRLIAVTANDQPAGFSTVSLMFHIVLVAFAPALNKLLLGEQVGSWHEPHLAGDVIAGADEHQLLGLAQGQTYEKGIFLLLIEQRR